MQHNFLSTYQKIFASRKSWHCENNNNSGKKKRKSGRDSTE
jgi:hypothetical protein